MSAEAKVPSPQCVTISCRRRKANTAALALAKAPSSSSSCIAFWISLIDTSGIINATRGAPSSLPWAINAP